MLIKKRISNQFSFRNNYPNFNNLYNSKFKLEKNFSKKNKREKILINKIPFEILLKTMIKSSNKTFEIIKKNYINVKYVFEKRKNYIKKIKDFIKKYKFKNSSFYLSIFLMDYIFLKKQNFHYLRNEEIILGSLFLSIKFNEKLIEIPNLKEISNNIFLNNCYSIEKLRKIEIKCLQILNYEIIYYTIYDYLNLFFNLFHNEDLKKESFQILEKLIINSNDYIFFKSCSLSIVILIYVSEKLNLIKKYNFNNLINDINLAKEVIIQIKNFIGKTIEKKEEKVNLLNKKGLKKIINKFKNNSQSPLKNQIIKNKKKKFISFSSNLTLNSKSPQIKKYHRNSSISTSSDEITLKNLNNNKLLIQYSFNKTFDQINSCINLINNEKHFLKKNVSLEKIDFSKNKFINKLDNHTFQKYKNKSFEKKKNYFSKKDIFSRQSTINITHSNKYNLYTYTMNNKKQNSKKQISNFESIWNKFVIKKKKIYLPKFQKFSSSNISQDKLNINSNLYSNNNSTSQKVLKTNFKKFVN